MPIKLKLYKQQFLLGIQPDSCFSSYYCIFLSQQYSIGTNGSNHLCYQTSRRICAGCLLGRISTRCPVAATFLRPIEFLRQSSLSIGWILLNVEMMPKILHYLKTSKLLLSNVRFSASFRRLEESTHWTSSSRRQLFSYWTSSTNPTGRLAEQKIWWNGCVALP